MDFSTQQILTLAGLALDLIGAVLLYFFTFAKKQIGNAVLDGENMYQLNDPKLRDVPESEWSPVFAATIKRSHRLTRLGFGLLVLGAVLQIVGTVVNT
jgi:hypothetical protein